MYSFDIPHLFGLPCRYIFVLLCCLGIGTLDMLRVNLSMAIVAMINEEPPVTKNFSEVQNLETCTELVHITSFNSTNLVVNGSFPVRGEFSWDSATRSQVLGSYFYGYVLTQIPGGVLADKYGAKWIFGIGMILSAGITVATPYIARWSVTALIASRVLIGLSSGVVYPASKALISRWSPIMERSRITTLILLGRSIGSASALALSGVICDSYLGWPAVFYFFGTIGCIWFAFWAYFVYDSPETHPRISKTELNFILESRGSDEIKNCPIPWKSILTSSAVWSLIFTHNSYNWGFYTFHIELPSYLTNILHFNLSDNGALSALPHLTFMVSSIVASVMADKLRKRGQLRITVIRKIFNSVGLFGGAICLLAGAYSGCRPVLVVVLLCTSMLLLGGVCSGFSPTFVDMSPEFAGLLFALSNTFSSISGFLVPIYTGWILRDGHTVGRWQIVFLTTTAVYVLGGIVFILFGKADLQGWGHPRLSPPDGDTVKCEEKKNTHKDPPIHELWTPHNEWR